MIKEAIKKYPMTWEQAVRWLLEQPDQRELVRACYYDSPLIEAARRYYNEAEWQAIRALVPQPPGRALDVGAGRGISSYALAADGWEVTALEPDPSPLVGAEAIRSLVRESGLNIKVIQKGAEELPFLDESFDIVHARQVLHHSADLEKFCREIARVLKKGGMLVASREHVIDRPEDLTMFLNSHPLHHLYGGECAYMLSRYKSALRDAGFKLKTVLSPLESPINYFPSTRKEVVNHAGRVLFGDLWRKWIPLPNVLITYVSRRLKIPGRLYSFVAIKI